MASRRSIGGVQTARGSKMIDWFVKWLVNKMVDELQARQRRDQMAADAAQKAFQKMCETQREGDKKFLFGLKK